MRMVKSSELPPSFGWEMVGARPVISILTDFGLMDPYVGQVKGVILSYCRDVVIIDLMHEVMPFNELQAAFILRVSAPYMPPATIHLCVVDPGVGMGRRGIILETTRGDVFVGPDTGLMVPAAEILGVSTAYEIDEPKLPPRETETFHARDVFAHVVGRLAQGEEPSSLGRRVESYAVIRLPEPVIEGNSAKATIMHVDRFGNLVTNLRPAQLGLELGDEALVRFPGRELRCRYVRSYGFVGAGQPLLTVGGWGYLELSVNRGSAAEILGLRPGDSLRITRAR
jgi:S-adenosylmethionine hydrolase